MMLIMQPSLGIGIGEFGVSLSSWEVFGSPRPEDDKQILGSVRKHVHVPSKAVALFPFLQVFMADTRSYVGDSISHGTIYLGLWRDIMVLLSYSTTQGPASTYLCLGLGVLFARPNCCARLICGLQVG
ncbi:hypothetical protein L1887_36162 [Cichorium endivia]|nr:hypothetical protein L1887_36162 [Cichorium endivia]